MRVMSIGEVAKAAAVGTRDPHHGVGGLGALHAVAVHRDSDRSVGRDRRGLDVDGLAVHRGHAERVDGAPTVHRLAPLNRDHVLGRHVGQRPSEDDAVTLALSLDAPARRPVAVDGVDDPVDLCLVHAERLGDLARSRTAQLGPQAYTPHT